MKLITCKKCNYETIKGAHFCPKCGHPLANATSLATSVFNLAKCPACNQPIAIAAKACPNCGKRHPANKAGCGCLIVVGILWFIFYLLG